jgi:hypothetical protein
MAAKEIDLKNVPALSVIQARLMSLDPGLSISAAGYDSDAYTYTLIMEGQGREGRAVLGRDLLDDIRDNKSSRSSRYTLELEAKLTDALRQVIEGRGLIAFSERALKYKLLGFVYEETRTKEHVEKYNTIGKDGPGDLERHLRIELTREEKETLIWIWDDLIRLRLMTPSGRDLVVPNDWVRLTDKGVAAIEGKSYVEYDDKEVFFSKGEDYGAYRKIKDIMAQARVEILVIDSYVDENLLDMCASLDASINVRVLSEHLKGDFKVGYRKLRKQRGKIEVRTLSHFHDRFIVIDGRLCYQLGGSINHAGAKATVIGLKPDDIRDRVVADAEKAWLAATPVS